MQMYATPVRRIALRMRRSMLNTVLFIAYGAAMFAVGVYYGKSLVTPTAIIVSPKLDAEPVDTQPKKRIPAQYIDSNILQPLGEMTDPLLTRETSGQQPVR